MKKIVGNYYDVYNFLNIINRRLGKLFKLTRYSPLPEGFVITEQNMTELLLLEQMKDEAVMPFFAGQEKKNIKKMFKNGLKHCQYVIKHHPFEKYCSKEFGMRVLVYFNIRKDLFDIMLKDFKTNEADEVEYYRECFNVNPVLGRCMDVLFEDKVDFDKLFDGLEEKYNLAYGQQLKLINKKETKKQEKVAQEIATNEVLKNSQKTENLQKNTQKTQKDVQKIAKNEKIAEIGEQNTNSKAGNKKEK